MTAYRLERCVWEITLACCFSCKYCGSRGGRARDNELTTAECLDVADQLADMGCGRVSLIGGEVFMRPDWKEITAKLTECGIAVNIITNGFRFRPELVNDLLSLGIESVSVSLDGPQEIHDKYRQTGSYERALEAVKVLSANEIPVSVISTLNSENVRHLETLYSVLKDTDIFAWQLQACSPMGNAANNGIPYAFSPSQVIAFVRSHLNDAPFALGIADNIGYFTPDDGFLRGDSSGHGCFGGCQAGLCSIGIDSVGNVRGCESMYDEAFNEGNLRQRSLRDIWEDENAFAYNRRFTPDKLTGACRTCELGHFCAGGCRSYNHFVHGRLYEAPRCARNEARQAAALPEQSPKTTQS